jgi:hypothetical protein
MTCASTTCHTLPVAIDDPEGREPSGVSLAKNDHPARWMWLVVLVIVVVGLVFGVSWLLTGLGGNEKATIFSIMAAIAAVGTVYQVSRALTPGHIHLRTLTTGASAIGCLLVVLGTWNSNVLAIKSRADETAWLAAAKQTLRETTPQSTCSAPPIDQSGLPGFGRVDERCVDLAGAHNAVAVRFIQGEGISRSGLLYMPHSADLQLQWDWCVAHLDGPWWQITSSTDHCPAGYHFVPAA